MPYYDSWVPNQTMRPWFGKHWPLAPVLVPMIAIVWIVLKIVVYLIITEPINRYYFPG
jgi:hypothetical protein